MLEAVCYIEMPAARVVVIVVLVVVDVVVCVMVAFKSSSRTVN